MATKFITVPAKTLAATIIASDMLLKPSDILGFDGVALTSSIIGDIWYCSLKNSSGTQMEIMKLDPTTVANYATTGITISKRGLSFDGAETEVTANKLTWIKNETIINFGTDVPQLLELMVKKEGNETINGVKTFGSFPVTPSSLPTTNYQVANKKYVDDKTGSALAVEVTQPSHGFAVGDIIRLNGINTYAKAQANSAANAEVVGIVTIVTDADNFAYTTEGAVTAGVPAVAAETVLFLSATTAGALTATAPTTAGYINLPLAVVTQNATKMVFHKYRGFEIGSTTAQASSITTFVASGATLALTTGANDKVVVWATGQCNTASASTHSVNLKYDGVTKDTVQVDIGSSSWGSEIFPFALHYTETPGAGTENVTVDVSEGSVSNVVIIAQVITPVSVSVGRTPNVQTVADAATITPVATTDDVVDVTAIAQAFTIAAPTGTVANGQKLLIRIKDNGTARAITWNAIYRAVGVVLPTTTVLSKTHYIGCVYNSNATKWDVVAVGQE